MLIYAAVVPHSPLLIPAIGKEKTDKLQKTADALKIIKERLLAAKPDTLVVVSPHGPILPDAFTINLNPSYTIDFKEFGDTGIKMSVKSDFLLIDKIHRAMREGGPQTVLISEENLDHGVSVPVFFLAADIKNIALVPVFPSELDLKTHFEFGKNLKNELLKSTKRIAVLASTNFSRTSEEAQTFDDKVINIIKEKRFANLLEIKEKVQENIKECARLQTLAITFGILDDVNIAPEVLSYERPFDVGLPVIDLKLG